MKRVHLLLDFFNNKASSSVYDMLLVVGEHGLKTVFSFHKVWFEICTTSNDYKLARSSLNGACFV